MIITHLSTYVIDFPGYVQGWSTSRTSRLQGPSKDTPSTFPRAGGVMKHTDLRSRRRYSLSDAWPVNVLPSRLLDQ